MQFENLQEMVRDVLCPARFFVGDQCRLRVDHEPRKTVAWETYAGQLLPPTMTRRQATFCAWEVFVDDEQPAAGPTISILFEVAEEKLHVTRGYLVYGHEAYEEEPNVILTRETRLWCRELVSTIDLKRLDLKASRGTTLDDARVRWLLERSVWIAVIGSSRLAITSLESPLPDFSLGRLAYLPSTSKPTSDTPPRSPEDLCRRAVEDGGKLPVVAKTIEFALRAAATARLPRLAATLWNLWHAAGRTSDELPGIVRRIFNDAVLSPYTTFGDHLLLLVTAWGKRERLGREAEIDLIGYMLRQLGRHLTAFDLVSFHNLGANYPDALLLDRLLKVYLDRVERHPDRFLDAADPDLKRQHRRRRRALRQAWLLRKTYELHRVPDRPTSAGDSLRVLPAPLPRVPEEQLTTAAHRRRRLFEGDLLDIPPETHAGQVLAASMQDLNHQDELRELGTALFLDRPLGALKPPGRIDRTPLLSYEAVSPQIATRRLRDLKRFGWLDEAALERHAGRLGDLEVSGAAVTQFASRPREGVASLEDAARAASDFVFVRTTRQSLDRLLAGYDFAPLRRWAPRLANWLTSSRLLLIRDASLPTPNRLVLAAFDAQQRRRLELEPASGRDEAVRYLEVAGREFIAGGLRVRCLVDDDGRPLSTQEQEFLLPPRFF